MDFSLDKNFVVVSTLEYEDNEGQLAIKFQIEVEKLFDEADLLEQGLIACSSGIKTEFTTSNYVINENLGYYIHETSSNFFTNLPLSPLPKRFKSLRSSNDE